MDPADPSCSIQDCKSTLNVRSRACGSTECAAHACKPTKKDRALLEAQDQKRREKERLAAARKDAAAKLRSTQDIQIADALTAIAQCEGRLWGSLIKSAAEARGAGRLWESTYDCAWSLLYGAGCDMDTGTRWDRLMVRIEAWERADKAARDAMAVETLAPAAEA